MHLISRKNCMSEWSIYNGAVIVYIAAYLAVVVVGAVVARPELET